HLHSFPTRRSSDLPIGENLGACREQVMLVEEARIVHPGAGIDHRYLCLGSQPTNQFIGCAGRIAIEDATKLRTFRHQDTDDLDTIELRPADGLEQSSPSMGIDLKCRVKGIVILVSDGRELLPLFGWTVARPIAERIARCKRRRQ